MIVNLLIVLIDKELPIATTVKFVLIFSIKLIIPPLIDEIIDLSKNVNIKKNKFINFIKKLFICN